MACASPSTQEEVMNSTRYYSKVKTEENHFQWRIENFRETIKPSAAAEPIPGALDWTVEVGESLGTKMRFSFYLLTPPRARGQEALSAVQYEFQGNNQLVVVQSGGGGGSAGVVGQQQQQQPNTEAVGETEPSNSYLSLRLQLDSENIIGGNDMSPSKDLQVYIKKKRPGDQQHYDIDSHLKETVMQTPRSWKFDKFIGTTPAALEQLMLVDKALILEIKLTVSTVTDANTEIGDFETSIDSVVYDALYVAGDYSDTVTLTCSGGGGCDSDSDDEEEVSSKAVLSARSSTLAGMFHRKPSQNKFNLDNITSSFTFHILLEYLHTGKLSKEGFSSYSEVLDVAVAAQQYGLTELFNYCDEILAPFCSMETASHLLCKSREYRLFKSSQAIMDYITAHLGSGAVTVGSGGNSVGRRAEVEASKANQEPRHRITMNPNYTIKEIVTTGVTKKVYPFTWKIERFKETVKKFHPQAAAFHNTRITGFVRWNWKNMEIQWKFSVFGTWTEEKFRIKIQCRSPTLTNYLNPIQKVHFYFGVALESIHNSIIWSPTKPARESSELEILLNKGYGRWVAGSSGTLSLKLQLIVLTSQIGGESRKGCKIFRTFCEDGTDKLGRDMESLYKTQPVFTDVTIISKEGHQFFAHWRFLAAHCAAFKSMFESGMEEVQSGVIKLPDVPRNAVDIMLAFIYTGRIPTSRFTTEADILDVAYVAEKYDLVGLKRYCDELLIEKCNLGNASELLAGATSYRLPRTQAAVKEFIKSNAGPTMQHADLVAELLAAPGTSSSSNP